jgi:hypothetical protein
MIFNEAKLVKIFISDKFVLIKIFSNIFQLYENDFRWEQSVPLAIVNYQKLIK